MDVLSEYKREVNRILNFWKRAENRGYVFNKKGIINNPKRITKSSVSRLKKFTPSKLYQKAKFNIPNTNIYVSGSEGRKYERQQAAKRGVETRRNFHNKRGQKIGSKNPPDEIETTLSNFSEAASTLANETVDREVLDFIIEQARTAEGTLRIGYNAWFNTKMQNNGKTVLRIIENAINKFGLKTLTRTINSKANEIIPIVNAIFDSKQQTRTTAEQHIAGLASILNGGTLDKDEIDEIIDTQYDEWFNDLIEWENPYE